jgi:hypothetical protein
MIIRSESRIVRPFIGLDKAEKAVSAAKLIVDGKDYGAGSIVLPDSQIRSASISLNTGTSLEELRKACDLAGVPHKSAKYVLIGRSRMFRKSSIVYEHTISSKNFDSVIDIDRLEEERFVFNDNSGFNLTAALVLIEENSSKPLQVKIPGTWLGAAHFSVRPQNDLSSFSPLPLDKNIRDKFGLRTGTYSYIDINEDLLELEDLGDGVVAYLDEDVLNLLLTDESESVSIAIQTQFAVQTLFTIGKRISQELTDANRELQELASGSGALRFVMRISEECKIDANDLLEIALKNESKFQSIIESRFGLAAKVQKLLKGN